MTCIFLVLHLINFACLYSLPALFYRMALMLHLCNASIFKAVVKWCIILSFSWCVFSPENTCFSQLAVYTFFMGFIIPALCKVYLQE